VTTSIGTGWASDRLAGTFAPLSCPVFLSRSRPSRCRTGPGRLDGWSPVAGLQNRRQPV